MKEQRIRFENFPFTRTDIEQYCAASKDFVASIQQAATAQQAVETIARWNAHRSHHDTNKSIASVRFTQNVKNEQARADHEFFEDSEPSIKEANAQVQRAIVQSPFRPAIEDAFGKQFVRCLEGEVRLISPEVKPLLQKEAKLAQRYIEITGAATISFEGEDYTLSGIMKLVYDTNRERRKAALAARWKFYEQYSDELDSLYHELVQVRHAIATTLGFSNYIEYQYLRMKRYDYKPADVAAFRKAVLEATSPLIERLLRRQKERLGVEKVYYHDEALFFAEGNPEPHGSPEWIIEQTSKMFKEFSPKTDEFWQTMVDCNLLDLVNRPGKAGGGYCTEFSEFALPFIFANFNGSFDDIRVLTHEAGHAFQAYCSLRNFDVPEYFFPTTEACEIHSMGMELLTWDWMEDIFKEQTHRFKQLHLAKAVVFLPYGCAVDEFQHRVFERPEMTPAERKALWKELEATYMPYRDYDDLPYLSEGALWQSQLHIYEYPFYYIDYVLAQVCVFGLWGTFLKDKEKALQQYYDICNCGGSKMFSEIVGMIGLDSPFKAETVHSALSVVVDWFEHYAKAEEVNS